MAGLHFTTIPCEPSTANNFFAAYILGKFLSVLTTLGMRGLSFKDFPGRFKGIRTLRLMTMVNVPVVIFFAGTLDLFSNCLATALRCKLQKISSF